MLSPSPFPQSVLFVCLGNICRSPLAEGIFRHLLAEAGLADQVATASAGTGAWHVGDPPDRRAIAVAADRGIDISGQRAQHLSPALLASYDLVLAMDRNNLRAIQALSGEGSGVQASVVALFSTYATGRMQDVPDPYYGEVERFQEVYGLLHQGCSRLVEKFASVRLS